MTNVHSDEVLEFLFDAIERISEAERTNYAHTIQAAAMLKVAGGSIMIPRSIMKDIPMFPKISVTVCDEGVLITLEDASDSKAQVH